MGSCEDLLLAYMRPCVRGNERESCKQNHPDISTDTKEVMKISNCFWSKEPHAFMLCWTQQLQLPLVYLYLFTHPFQFL